MTELVGPGDGLADRGAEAVRRTADLVPSVAVITGSGLGGATADIEVVAELTYADLPGFPPPTVAGHEGKLVLGRLAGVPVAVFLGRIHYYEGHPMSLVTLPTRLAAALGAGTLVVTAAVGGLDPSLEPGTMVVGSDHINFLGVNPLQGWTDASGGPAFVSLAGIYPDELAAPALRAAEEVGLPAARGVYAAMPGPTYETPAEVGFLRGSGATVVGMSVVPEVCAAAALGLRCLGLYCVTNKVGGPVSHEEVKAVAERFSGGLGQVLARVLPEIGEERDGV